MAGDKRRRTSTRRTAAGPTWRGSGVYREACPTLFAEAGECFERGAERALGGGDAALEALENLLLVTEGSR